MLTYFWLSFMLLFLRGEFHYYLLDLMSYEQEICTKENHSSDNGDMSIFQRGTEGYVAVVALYKFFLVQKEKLRTYNQMYQEEEKMLEKALSS